MKTFISVVIIIIVVGGLVFLANRNGRGKPSLPESVQNVSIVDGKQIIEITAKGGYTPAKSIAKAGMPTVLRINTEGTFDCSASVRIPSMNIATLLPNSGTQDIDLGTPKVGVLQGTCGMGMYPFEINFQ